MAGFEEQSVLDIKMNTIPNELARQLAVVRLLQIVKQRQQPIPLTELCAAFEREAEQEEKMAVGSSVSEIALCIKAYPGIFIINRWAQRGHSEIYVWHVDDASVEKLPLLNGILKLKGILKQKGGRMKIKQLSTFFNQQSSFEERKVIGRNPKTLTQTIQPLPRIFEVHDDSIAIKLHKSNTESEEHPIPVAENNGNSDGSDMSQIGSKKYPKDAPISYASAVTANTNNDDSISQARRSGISKIRNYLLEFGTSTFSHLLSLIESKGTQHECQAIGTDLKALQATLQGLPNIFAATGQFVDLKMHTHRVNAFTRIAHFLKTKGSCEIVQIVGFMGQQRVMEEREALGKNPCSLRNTLLMFPDIFVLKGTTVTLKWMEQSQNNSFIRTTDGFGGITSTLSPTHLHRVRNESIGVDSGYEGSVTLDQPDHEISNPKNSSNEQHAIKISEEADSSQFTLIDVKHNQDIGFQTFKAECLDSCNEFEQPVIGVMLSDDCKWMAVSTCSDRVYLVDLQTCVSTSGADDQDSVLVTLKEVLGSSGILKIVFDCHVVAAALRRHFNIVLSNVFDTMRAQQLLTCDEPVSVNDLCTHYENVTPPYSWSAVIGGLRGWKVVDSGGHTSDIGMAANARVLVPQLYRRMMVRFTATRLNEVLRLCEQIVKSSSL